MDRLIPGSKIKARDQNELADAARRLDNMTAGGMKIASSPAGISMRLPSSTHIIKEAAVAALALNIGPDDLPAYGACGISGHGPEGDDAQSSRIFLIRTPVAESDTAWFGITAEPIPQNKGGRVYLAGVCLARVLNPDSQWYLEVVDGQTYLAGVASGSAQKLWEDTVDLGGGVHLALVRFPVGGGGSEDMAVCHAASTANLTLSGLDAVDGVTIVEGHWVLAKDQSTPSQNGVYRVRGAAWTKIAQTPVCHILGGTANGRMTFMQSAANTYSRAYAAVAPTS